MKVKIKYWCNLIQDDECYHGKEIHIGVELPFLPPTGSFLMFTKQSGYLEVDTIFIDLNQGGEGLSIFLKCPKDLDDLPPWDVMEKDGWKLL